MRKVKDPDPYLLTNGSGSRRPKKMRIRIPNTAKNLIIQIRNAVLKPDLAQACGAGQRELCVPEIGGNEPADGGGGGEGQQGGDQVHHSEYQVGVPPFYPHYSLC